MKTAARHDNYAGQETGKAVDETDCATRLGRACDRAQSTQTSLKKNVTRNNKEE